MNMMMMMMMIMMMMKSRRIRQMSFPNILIPWSRDRLATTWMVLVSKTGGGQNFRSRPFRPEGPLFFLYSGNRVALPGVKQTVNSVTHPFICSAEFKNGGPITLLPHCVFMAWYRRTFALSFVYTLVVRETLSMWQFSFNGYIMFICILSQFWEFISHIRS
jgi:hypothetical protein